MVVAWGAVGSRETFSLRWEMLEYIWNYTLEGKMIIQKRK